MSACGHVIREGCIADLIYLRYIQHINKRKQRQGYLSLFSRLKADPHGCGLGCLRLWGL